MSNKLPIHRLPLPSQTLQSALPQLELEPSPISQRRATTFAANTEGIWARVNPLWAPWPLRVTKEELLEMGFDVDKGDQVKVVDVLKRWDPVDPVDSPDEVTNGDGGRQVKRWTSAHRSKLDAHILGLSAGTLRDCLPHLDADSSSLNDEATTALKDVLSGRHVLAAEDGSYGPWSTRYCGHQFGVWAGQLGDGRAISLLETTSEKGGRQEIQLKGAGRTPFSRTADGLAVLRSGVREYLGCEAVAALDIPTTRALALLGATDLPVIRETGPEPTSLTARIAPSFIRIGHFEALSPSQSARNSRNMFFGGNWQDTSEDDQEGGLGGQGNLESLAKLTSWCTLVMKELGWLNEGAGAKEFFQEVVRRNAEMVAGWQVYGFCHGVINTDNVSILGLTIDYGPYAFMDVFDESHICNHSDPSGLYNYRNQPSRILFALDKLQQALAPLIGYEAMNGPASEEGWSVVAQENDVDEWRKKAMEELGEWDEKFWETERAKERSLWLKRFGLKMTQASDDKDIVVDFLTNLHTYNMDFHTSFRRLVHFSPTEATSITEHITDFILSFVQSGIVAQKEAEVERAVEGWKAWFGVYAKRASEEGEKAAWGGETDWEVRRKEELRRSNPRFVLRQWVLEELIKRMEGALEGDDRESAKAQLAKMLEMASNPYETYGEDVGDGACPTAEVEEERRLCGLGSREMLGFQCSCSS